MPNVIQDKKYYFLSNDDQFFKLISNILWVKGDKIVLTKGEVRLVLENTINLKNICS